MHLIKKYIQLPCELILSRFLFLVIFFQNFSVV